jgi:hypothetical protein
MLRLSLGFGSLEYFQLDSNHIVLDPEGYTKHEMEKLKWHTSKDNKNCIAQFYYFSDFLG